LLIQNGYRDAFTGTRLFGAGILVNGAYPQTSQYGTGMFRNIFASDAGIPSTASIPQGTRHPVAWQMPQKPGALASINSIEGSGTLASNILAVKLAEASLTGSGDLTAIGGLIVQLLADILGEGEITDADIKAFLQISADLSGQGAAAGTISAFAELIAEIDGLGEIVASLVANGLLSADLVVTGTGLTTANVGPAVWSAIAASNDVVGTMGEKLNDAGAAGNPWAADAASNNSPGTMGEKLNQVAADVPTAAEAAQAVWEYIVDSGFSAEEVIRLVASMTAANASGLEGIAPQFRDLADTKTRISATYIGGNRTIDTLDVS